MKSVDNSQITEIFEDMANMLDIQGENRFRVLAYRKAVLVISELTEELRNMVKDGRDLTELSGIGKDLSERIKEIISTGTCKLYKQLQKKTPLSLVRLINLQDLGPKKVKKLYESLNVKNIKDLEKSSEHWENRPARRVWQEN